MQRPKILFVSQSIRPYLPDDEVAIGSRLIAQGTTEAGSEIRTFMPKFGDVNERRNQLHEVIRLSGLNVVISEMDHPLLIKVASIPTAKLQVYFFDNDDLFQRHGIFTDPEGNPFDDNLERCIFYARGVLDTAHKLRWQPQIVHLHGWFSMLFPLYLKYYTPNDPFYKGVKIVVSLYNDPCPDQWTDVRKKLWVKGIKETALRKVTFSDWRGLMKLAMDLGDAISVCTPDPDPELLEYARASGKPLLEYPDNGDLVQAHQPFYQKLVETPAKKKE